MAETFAPLAVIDCVVYLQAAGNEAGPAAALLRRAEAGELRLLVSADILQEVRGVLVRPAIRRRLPHLSNGRIEQLVEFLFRAGGYINPVPRKVTLERDPKDEKYLDLVVVGEADYLVS